ncbi:MAG: hypothetical protein M3Z27_05130, partial [Actinomycetota bacterium]|nr:hypothetical protein [Actinomycetota bacterium]
MELEDVVLELLGPRWRREARLDVDDPARREQHTLPPADFFRARPSAQAAPPGAATGSQAAEDPAPAPPGGGPASEEQAPGASGTGRTPAPVGAPQATIAPKRQPRRSHTTMFRIARRHQGGEGGVQA